MTPSLVIDSSVAVKWFVEEDGSAAARQLLGDYANGKLRLLAPDHFLAEVANIAWKKSTIRGELQPDEAAEAIRKILTVCPELVDSTSLVLNALSLAHQHRRTVYDTLYVALAWQRQCDFVTADLALVRALNVPWVRPLTSIS